VAKKSSQSIDPAQLVLTLKSPTDPHLLDRYEPFLAALCTDRDYQKEATRAAISYLLGGEYRSLSELAEQNYQVNPALSQLYPDRAKFLKELHLPNKLYATLDLATGTGKSYVLYALAQIMLAAGVVDNVLVLCPSRTIKEGLTAKFNDLASNTALAATLGVIPPTIIDASDTLTANSICVTNIHQTYKTVNSAIGPTLTRSGGERTLVLNDEVHHIVGPGKDQDANEWLKFLNKYRFRYIIGVTGTPYTGSDVHKANSYFSDVIYRYSLTQATAEERIKDIYYKDEGKHDDEEQVWWRMVFDNHERNRSAYQLGHGIKPLTIIITSDQDTCDIVRDRLVRELMLRGLSQKVAEGTAIPVTSADRHLKYVARLPYVDDANDPTEWIVSVSKLNEGWDVKNVFQIVPHESRAFDSKLLIAQVLGRGLRLPWSVRENRWLKTAEARLIVFNHPRFSANIAQFGVSIIRQMVGEVGGLSLHSHIVNAPPRDAYHFTLHNLSYKLATPQPGGPPPFAPTAEPKAVTALNFASQIPADFASAHYRTLVGSGEAFSQSFAFTPARGKGYNVAQIVTAYRAALKDMGVSQDVLDEYSASRLEQMIRKELADLNETEDYISPANFNRGMRALAVLRPTPTVHQLDFSLEFDTLTILDTRELKPQGKNITAFRANHTLFYDNHSRSLTEPDSLAALDALFAECSAGVSHCQKVDSSDFRTPVNVVFSESGPERGFMAMLTSTDPRIGTTMPPCLKAWIKSADSGYYTINYTMPGYGKRDFNPDFFLKLEIGGREVIMVVETKIDNDIKPENVAKRRGARSHFAEINRRLAEMAAADGQPHPRYVFSFMSPRNYENFFAHLHTCTLQQLEDYRSVLEADLLESP